ncbi:hypothetical protein [Synechocystis salina]|uniref:hypothetical protein n=1 Tax=Synechocystis salina TaxID=945780 RepID=UPI001D142355|nr:hypothetical protein [Synechocystis salina]
MLSYRYALSLALCFSLPLSVGGRAVAEGVDFSPVHGFAPVTDIDRGDNAQAIGATEFFLSQGQVPTPPLQPLPSEEDVEIPPSPPPLELGPESSPPSPEEAVDTCGFSPSPSGNVAPIPLLRVSVDGSPLEVNLLGMTVFSPQELLTLPALQPWQTAPPSTSAPLTIATDLTGAEFEVLYQGLVAGITQLYINQGYITSQAIAKPMEPIPNGGG